jgi:hypothetical protein
MIGQPWIRLLETKKPVVCTLLWHSMRDVKSLREMCNGERIWSQGRAMMESRGMGWLKCMQRYYVVKYHPR